MSFKTILDGIYIYLKQNQLNELKQNELKQNELKPIEIPDNLKYTVRAWNIGPFYKLMSDYLNVKPSDLILTLSLPYRYNPCIDLNSNIIVIGLESDKTYEKYTPLDKESTLTIIELTDNLISKYFKQPN